MRKELRAAIVALLVWAWIPSYAQKGTWEIDAGIGYVGVERLYPLSEINLSTKNPSTILPTFSLRGGYSFSDYPIGLFFEASYSYAKSVYKGGPSPLVEEEPIVHLVPQLRIYYLKSNPRLKMYCSLGAGVRIRQYSETLEGDTIKKTFCNFSWTVSPFGISVGPHWNIGAEFGVGLGWSLGRFCVGYRF